MLTYIFILLAAIIIFPLLFTLVARGVVRKSSLWIALSGLNIAVIGTFIQQNFSLYYTILAMAGLVFAISVLLEKRRGQEKAEKPSHESKEPTVVLPTEPILVEDEAAATTAGEFDDEFALTPLEHDLDRWMASEQKEVSGEPVRKEGQDEQ
ncbi:hypothetical protein AB1K83_07065 [Sporosarcina sp. 179-K 3D1 HS]|uniref:hypothetical protein n=1 Tax=Sporosarcina sp. 179-K 3D1 HS TaxID=3232169 RepID=UPI0039A101F8